MNALTEANWEEIEKYSHFKRTENWGDPYAICKEFLLYHLIPFRLGIKRPIKIHCAKDTSGHSPDSMHYRDICSAVDISIAGRSLFDECRMAMNYDFDGIGAYPYSWASKGLHLDKRTWYGKPKIFWIEDEKKQGKYRYFSNADDFLIELGRIPGAMEVY